MSRKFTPYVYQDMIINFITSVARCGIWAGMGLGKTVSALTAIDCLKLMGLINKPVLVIAPLRVAMTTWPDEVKKWDHLKHLKIVPVLGTQWQRIQALRTPADIYTINYENIEWMI